MDDKTMMSDDALLQQFFGEARQTTLADDGFSHRVIRRLPERINWYSRLWTLGCCVVFAVLFVVFDGLHLLQEHLMTMMRSAAGTTLSIRPLMVISVFLTLLLVGVAEVAYSER